MYGAKQARKIWRSLLETCLHSWKFNTWRYDARLYFFRKGNEVVIVAIVVDDIAFDSYRTHLMALFKKRFSAKFNDKLFFTLSSFNGWQIFTEHDHIKVHKMRYADSLLLTNGLDQENSVWTPLPSNEDLLPAHLDEHILSQIEHYKYRAIIGGFDYLAVCTRPDFSFPISVLARHLNALTPVHVLLEACPDIYVWYLVLWTTLLAQLQLQPRLYFCLR